MTTSIFNGDCLELMKTLPDKSIDLFICDLPYGETNCKWDSIIDLDEFWAEFRRLRKSKKVPCIHFCSTKFGYTLIKSWEKGFKMDMVWKKRNKTGGLQSRHRPMRNHEMVYFFYEQAPKYNRDKYHKRIQAKLPIVKDDNQIFGKGYNEGEQPPFNSSKYFEPPNPVSVVEEKEPPDQVYSKKGWKYGKQANSKDYRESMKAKGLELKYDPPNPASVLEEKHYEGMKNEDYNSVGFKKQMGSAGANFEPSLPGSVFDSQKVFIGKRHHQTEKPQDILEFFLKYWSDEGDTILDPTMGSGSTGVACKNLKRNFIGYELDPKIFEVAKKRLEIDENVVEI